ncbi:hypothetical protein ACWDOR_38835 [Streptosporangium canum]|uniref:hypothetical protein n=1 Tax=Streptosporangium canum TaxID=324952 RepID=UPI0036B6571E
MARKRMVSIFLAAAIGGGFALATATMATAETGMPAIAVVSAPYPPGPVNNNNNNNGPDSFEHDFDCDDDNNCCSEESCCGGGCHAVKELPFTGAPVATVATLGGGLLAVGTAASLIAVRRRRSTSAI